MKKLFDFETTQFDFDLINHVKNLRKEHGFTKDELSLKMGVANTQPVTPLF